MFTNQFNRKTPAVKYTTDGCNDYFIVQPDLALTPAQMMDMQSRGIPINLGNASLFSDGSPNPSFDIPIAEQRGIDIAEVWSLEKLSRKNIRTAYQNDVSLYGK